MVYVDVKQLFNYNRINDGTFGVLLLYLPIGILLIVARFIILLIVLLLATVLPKTQLLQAIYEKLLCITFGISVAAENVDKREEVDAIVSNQVSILDSFVIHLLTQCLMPSPSMDTPLSRLLGRKYFGPLTNIEALKNSIALYSSKRKPTLLLQPESVITNGRGLLRFNTWTLGLASKIQPVLIEIQRPVLHISVSTIESTFWSDVLCYMFSPITVYRVRFMPAIEKKTFSDDEFCLKVQKDMARSLQISATDHTAADMKEYQKRYFLQQEGMQASVQRRVTYAIPPELQRMGAQVKEVLPVVPLHVIYRDLVKTRSVDVTITNILDGSVRYVPENPAAPSTSRVANSKRNSTDALNALSATPSCSQDPFSTAASTFGKSANERSLSFQERKAQLIANARQRYIEKHGLNLALNNC